MKDHPTTFGVFKPVDHVLLSFAPQADVTGAASALLAAGFPEADLKHYSPAQMVAQAESDLHTATALASIGQELNLVKSQLELARQGYSFLLVKAKEDEQIEQVTAVATKFHAERAQRYGTLLIEELVTVGSGETQVAESPDRGLDEQTPTGRQD